MIPESVALFMFYNLFAFLDANKNQRIFYFECKTIACRNRKRTGCSHDMPSSKWQNLA